MNDDLETRMMVRLHLHGLSANTMQSYLGCARRFACWACAAPDELDREVVESFLVHLARDRKVAPSTLAQYRAALRFLYSEVLDRPDVTTDLPCPRVIHGLPEVLSRHEIARVVHNAPNSTARAAIMAGYLAGLRVSEVRCLTDDRFRRDQGLLTVRRGKGDLDRTVVASTALLDAVDEHKRSVRTGSSPWLFPGRDPQRPVHDRTLNRYLAKALRRAGIRRARISFHSLRHSFATHLIEDGASIRDIQALLGHRRLETTARYTHVASSHFERVRAPVERLSPLTASREAGPLR